MHHRSINGINASDQCIGMHNACMGIYPAYEPPAYIPPCPCMHDAPAPLPAMRQACPCMGPGGGMGGVSLCAPGITPTRMPHPSRAPYGAPGLYGPPWGHRGRHTPEGMLAYHPARHPPYTAPQPPPQGGGAMSRVRGSCRHRAHRGSSSRRGSARP